MDNYARLSCQMTRNLNTISIFYLVDNKYIQ
jgi:hypothetical protein